MNFWDFADKHSDGFFFILFMLCVVIMTVAESICKRNRVKKEKVE